MEYFTRYYVCDDMGEVQEIYDGNDDEALAIAALELYPGGSVKALDYVSDGQYRTVKDTHATKA